MSSLDKDYSNPTDPKYEFIYDFKEEAVEESIIGNEQHLGHLIDKFLHKKIEEKGWTQATVDFGRDFIGSFISPLSTRATRVISSDSAYRAALVDGFSESLGNLYIQAIQTMQKIHKTKKEIEALKSQETMTEEEKGILDNQLLIKQETLLTFEKELAKNKLDIVVLKCEVLVRMLGYFQEIKTIPEADQTMFQQIVDLNKYYENEKTQIAEVITKLDETITVVHSQREKIFGLTEESGLLRQWTAALGQKLSDFFVVKPTQIYEDQWDSMMEGETKIKWSETDWGQLLMPPESSWFDKFSKSMGMATGQGFATTIDGLKACKKDLQKKIIDLENQREILFEKMPPALKSTPQLDEGYKELNDKIPLFKKQLDEVNIHLQRTLLQRVIDVMSAKYVLLNKKNKEVAEINLVIEDLSNLNQRLEKDCASAVEEAKVKEWQGLITANMIRINNYRTGIKKIQEEIVVLINQTTILDKVFEKKIKKYESTQRPSYTILELMVQLGKEQFKSLVTLGYINNHYIAPHEFRKQKAYAEQGYNMVENVQLWLQNLSGSDWRVVLQKEVGDFLEWADKHPETASELAGDIALTCSIMGDQSFVDKINATISMRVYTKACLGELGRNPKATEVEKGEELRFKALADLARYAPIAAGVVQGAKGVAIGASMGPGFFIVNGIWGIVKNGSQAAVTQGAIKAIPEDQEEVALLILKGVRGDSIQDILATQRHIEMVRLAGNVRKAIQSPGSVMKDLSQRISNWWQITVKESHGWEKFLRVTTQLVLPATIAVGGVALSLGLFVTAGPLGLAVVATMIAGVAATSTTLAVFIPPLIHRYLNRIFPETLRAIKDKQAKALSETPENQQKIFEQKNIYISDLQKRGALPLFTDYHLPEDAALQGKIQTKFEEVEEILNKKLELLKQDQQVNHKVLEVKAYVKLFQSSMSLDKVVGGKSQKALDYRSSLLHDAKNIAQEYLKIDLKGIEDLEKRNSAEKEVEAFAEEIVKKILKDLMEKWVEPHVAKGFQDQFILLLWQHDAVPKYDKEMKKEETAVTQEMPKVIEKERKSLAAKIGNAAADSIFAQVDAELGIKERSNQEDVVPEEVS